jgi:hypothetical protein
VRYFVCLLGVLMLACGGGGEEPEPIVEGDADVDSDSDADSDSDGDTDSEGYLEPGEPDFTAVFDGAEWVAEDGHWLAGSTSYLVGTRGDAEVVVVVDGDVGSAGEYDVSEASYFETVHNGYAFYYKTTGGSATFTVDGHDIDRDYVWGEFDGELSLTDTEGAGSIVLEDLSLESWLRYGAR